MAMITCKECKGDVSKEAASCPHCGVQVPGISDEKIEHLRKGLGFFLQRWIAGIVFFVGVALLLLAVFFDIPAEEFLESWSIVKWLLGFGAVCYFLSEFNRNMYLLKIKKEEESSVEEASVKEGPSIQTDKIHQLDRRIS